MKNTRINIAKMLFPNIELDNISDETKEMIFTTSAQYYKVDILTSILDEESQDISNKTKGRGLAAAALKGRIDIVGLLLDRESQNISTEYKGYAFSDAQDGHNNIVRLLLDKESQNISTEQKKGALESAFIKKDIELAKIMICNGVEFNNDNNLLDQIDQQLSNYGENQESRNLVKEFYNSVKEELSLLSESYKQLNAVVNEVFKVVKNKDVRNMFSASRFMRTKDLHKGENSTDLEDTQEMKKDKIEHKEQRKEKGYTDLSPIEALPLDIQNNIAYFVSEADSSKIIGPNTQRFIRRPIEMKNEIDKIDEVNKVDILNMLVSFGISEKPATTLKEYMSMNMNMKMINALKTLYVSEVTKQEKDINTRGKGL